MENDLIDKENKKYSNDEILRLKQELKQLVFQYPNSIGRHLQKKERKYLFDFVQIQTKLYLGNLFYTIITKCYWIINDIKDWNDIRVKCKICGKPLTHYNIKNFKNGYCNCCSSKCSKQYNKKINEKYDPLLIDEYRKEMLQLYELHKNNILKMNEYSYLNKVAIDSAPECIKKHSKATKKYWFMHNITTFPKCSVCGKDITRNVINAFYGYTFRNDDSKNELFCSGNCAKKSKHYINAQRNAIIKKFGKINQQQHVEYPEYIMSKHDRSIYTKRLKIYNKICQNQFVIPNITFEQFYNIRPSIKCVTFEWKCLECGRIFNSSYSTCVKFLFKNFNKCVNARCPFCYPRCNTASLQEKQLYRYCKETYPQYEFINNQIENWKIISPLQLDILVKKNNNIFCAIEFNGSRWHSIENNSSINRQLNKTLKCDKLNIPLIHIYEDEWITSKDKIKRYLDCLFNSSFIFPDNEFILSRDKFPIPLIQNKIIILSIDKPSIDQRYSCEFNQLYNVPNCGKLHCKIKT